MATPLSFPRRYFLLFLSIILIAFVTLSIKIHLVETLSEHLNPAPPPPPPPPVPEPVPEPEPEPLPVVEIFPDAANGDIPEILALNRPPKDHPQVTPLFIGFTRNWPMLQQTVVSYITAGWPSEDIYVVDNTGVMDSNELGLLTLQNPFFVDYPRLRTLGVNILTTPTLFTFAQLQNYFIYTSIQKKWPHFYWSHMDSVALSDEDRTPYRSLYQGIIDAWNEMDHDERWATKFFAYDHLALVNVAAFKEVGAWDTQIPFYHTDCDMHSRLEWANYSTNPQRAGMIYDVASTVPDLGVFYPSNPHEEVNGTRFRELVKTLDRMQAEKAEAKGGRNTWQVQQMGGQGEPFYRDPKVGSWSLVWGVFTGELIGTRASTRLFICGSIRVEESSLRSGGIGIVISIISGQLRMHGRFLTIGKFRHQYRHELSADGHDCVC